MKRELKFKVWDYCAGAFANNGEGVDIGEGLGEPHFGYEVEYLQYTGLKDKNGREIYEGDIIKIKRLICSERGEFDDYTNEVELVVAFDRDRFSGFSKYDLETKLNPSNLRFNLDHWTLEEFKVIGNILEKQKP